jgi:hypothetical protein
MTNKKKPEKNTASAKNATDNSSSIFFYEKRRSLGYKQACIAEQVSTLFNYLQIANQWILASN